MFRRTSSISATILTTALLLTGCLGSDSSTDLPEAPVEGAREAVITVASFAATPELSYRPTALMGIYTGMFFANGEYLPVVSARQGVMAQMQLHVKPSEESMENTYALLDEFALIMQVDLPELLDRSTDRASTLNEYTKGLDNITTRAERRLVETDEYLDTLQDKERDLKRELNDLNRAARKSLDAQEFSAAAEQQKAATELQTQVSTIDNEQRQFTELKRYMQKLLDIAHARQKAIAENREVLIAGLKVISVPGAEDVGVLELQNIRKRNTTGGNAFGEI